MPAEKEEKTSSLTTNDAQAVKPEPLRVLLTWEAPVRPFKKRHREYFSTMGAIVFLLGVILLFLKEWFLILVAIALMFVVYVLGTVEPEKTKHQITNRGLVTGGRAYSWLELGRFWFAEKYGQSMLHLETSLRFPGRLTLLLGNTNQEQIKKLLADFLLHEEPTKTWMDKTSEWLTHNLPLEKI